MIQCILNRSQPPDFKNFSLLQDSLLKAYFMLNMLTNYKKPIILISSTHLKKPIDFRNPKIHHQNTQSHTMPYHCQLNLKAFIPSTEEKYTHFSNNSMSSYIKVTLNRDLKTSVSKAQSSSQPHQLACSKQLIKAILYQEKIALSQLFLKFQIPKQSIPQLKLQIFSVENNSQQKVSSFSFPTLKYIEMFNSDSQKYFEGSTVNKDQSTLQFSLFIENDILSLQNLISSVNSQQRRQRSESARRLSRKKDFAQEKVTIDSIYQQSCLQNTGLRKSKNTEKFSNQWNHQPKSMKHCPRNFLQNSSRKENLNSSTSGGNTTPNLPIKQKLLKNMYKTDTQHRSGIDVSRITQVMNSEQYSQKCSEGVETSKLDPESPFNISSLIGSPVEVSSSHKRRSTNKQGSDLVKLNSEIKEKPSSEVTSQFHPLSERSGSSDALNRQSSTWFDESRDSSVIGTSSDEFSLAHSSELSAKSELKRFHQRKWVLLLFVILLIIFVSIVSLNAAVPKSKNRKGKSKK